MDHIKTDPRLLELLERARKYEMTPAEVRTQRVAWVRAETDADEETIRRTLALPTVEEERVLAGLRDGSLAVVPKPTEAVSVGTLPVTLQILLPGFLTITGSGPVCVSFSEAAPEPHAEREA